MKKRTRLLAAAMLLFLLAACGAPEAGETDGTPFDWPDPPKTEQKNDSLTIYAMGADKGVRMLEKAVTLFRVSHPGVKIELISEDYNNGLGYDAYEKVATEIMAGSGPDVLMISDTVLNVEKMVRQGVFADMEPFFEAGGFDWSPYNQTVMDGGVWDGRRYVVPLSYDFPLLVTTRTALEETGFSVDACKDHAGFLEETRRFIEDPDQTRALFFLPTSFMVSYDLTEFSGVPYANYDTQTADLSHPEIAAIFQWFKLFQERYNPENIGMAGGLYAAAGVRDGEALWAQDLYAGSNFYFQYAALKTIDEPVMMPIRDIDGGIQAHLTYPVAVRANSENLQNAYDFLKLLLSKEVQGGFAGLYAGYQLSVLDQVNIDYYHHSAITPGNWESYVAGVQGFTSTVRDYNATDWPSEEEFEQFMALTREISGTYFSHNLQLMSSISLFARADMDLDEAIQDAQRKLEIRISE